MSFRAESLESSSLLGPPRTRDTRSGAIAMKPSAAIWSATPRTHVERPKISWTTTTTGDFAFAVDGYTTQAMSESLEPGSHATFTHSAWRGLSFTRAAALLLLAGRPAIPCPAPPFAFGAAMSAADICDTWSSADDEARLHAIRAAAMAQLPVTARMKFTTCSTWQMERLTPTPSNEQCAPSLVKQPDAARGSESVDSTPTAS